MKKNQNTESDSKLGKAIDAMEREAHMSAAEQAALEQDEDMKQACRDIACLEKVLLRQHCPAPDVEAELAKVLASKNASAGRSRSRRLWMMMAGGVAAMLALALLMRGWAGDDPAGMETSVAEVVEEKKMPTDVTLQVGTSAALPVSSLTEADLRQSGALLDGGNGMTYANASSETVVSNTLSVPQGKDFKLVLADGTEVWLNAGSRLVYPNRFTGDNRAVRLEGEAYFDVARDERRPFVVETDYLQAEVLGTEFNVRAYRPSDCHVTLVDGCVRVEDAHGHYAAELSPGQDAGLSEGRGFVVKAVDTEIYTAWKDGMFYFDNATLGEIMDELCRWYGVEAAYAPSVDKNVRLRFMADRRKGVEQALDLLNSFGRVTASYDAESRRVSIK